MCVGGGRRAGCIFKDFGVPSMFSIMFLKFSMCSPQHVPNSTTLLSHMFCPKLSSFYLCRWAKGDALYIKTCKI
jgi:hypothetical protein